MAQPKARTGGAARQSDERLVALYLDMLAAERGAQSNTLAAYGRDLADFSAYLGNAGQSIGAASTDDLRTYLGELSLRGLRATTVARRLSAVRQLYRFLYAERHRGDDPAAVLEGPRRAQTLPKTLTLAEVERLLGAAGAAIRLLRYPCACALRERVPARDALCHGPARLRTDRPSGRGCAARRPRHCGARQRQ